MIELTEKRTLSMIPGSYSIAKFSQPVWQQIAESKLTNVFVAKTNEEFSVIADDGFDFANASDVNSGWRGFRVQGELDFAIIGLIADVTRVLAESKISVVAISTFDTDYFFVQTHHLDSAKNSLISNGYVINNESI